MESTHLAIKAYSINWNLEGQCMVDFIAGIIELITKPWVDKMNKK